MTTTPNLKPVLHDEPAFSEIVQLIQASRLRAVQSVNTVLIDLYWKVGEIISSKLQAATEATPKAPIGLFRGWQRTQTQSSVRTLRSLRQQMDVRFRESRNHKPRGVLACSES